MKRKLLSLFLTSVMTIGVMTGCSSNETDDSAAKGDSEKTIGICLPTAQHGWLGAVTYYAEKQAKDLGVNYKLVTGANPNEQAGKIDELLAQNVDCIVMLPTDTDPMTPSAQKVLDAGVPLVIFDRKVNVEPTYYVAGNNPAIGTNAGNYIGEKLEGKGNAVIISVPSGGSVSTERVEAFKKEIAAKYPDIKIVKEVAADSFARESGLKVMTDLLQSESQIDAVFSIDDELSIGALQAIKEAKRSDIKVITGGGGAKEYFDKIKEEKDINLASFLYSPSMISEAVKVGVDIMNGKMPSNKEDIIDAKGIDKENVDTVYDGNSPY